MVTESSGSPSNEREHLRNARRQRLRFAVAAVVASVGSAAVADTAPAEPATVLLSLGSIASLIVLWRRRTDQEHATVPTSGTGEHLALVLASLAIGAFVLYGADVAVGSWRFTAAAVAASAPNCYVVAANLLPRRVAGA